MNTQHRIFTTSVASVQAFHLAKAATDWQRLGIPEGRQPMLNRLFLGPITIGR